MSLAKYSEKHVLCLSLNVSLGKLGSSIMKELERFIFHNGPEFTVKRYKNIESACNLLRAGSPELAREVYQQNSISYNKRTLYPKGPLGSLVKSSVETNKESTLIQCMGILKNLHKHIILKHPSNAQVEKSLKTITGTNRTRPFSFNLAAMYFQVSSEIGDQLLVKGHGHYERDLRTNQFIDFNNMMSKADDLKAFSYYYYDELMMPKPAFKKARYKVHKAYVSKTGELKDKVMYSYGRIPYLHMALSYASSPWVPPSLESNIVDKGGYIRLREATTAFYQNNPELSTHSNCVGRVTILQEGSCKARVVAQPSMWVALAFRPLNDLLGWMDKHIPSICTFDQDKGAEAIRHHMSQGYSVFSVDLSAATDTVPLENQLTILHGLGLSRWANALLELVQKDFYFDHGLEMYPSIIKYKVGQPMGVPASFHLFTLENYITARIAEMLVEQSGVDVIKFSSSPDKLIVDEVRSFFIIGDDIVFSDPIVAETYTQIRKDQGVEISTMKSFESDNFAEFAGYFFTKTVGRDGTKRVSVLKPFKVDAKNPYNVSNPLRLLPFLKEKAHKVLSFGRNKSVKRYWKKVGRLYLDTLAYRDFSLQVYGQIGDNIEPCQPYSFKGDYRQISQNLQNVDRQYYLFGPNDPRGKGIPFEIMEALRHTEQYGHFDKSIPLFRRAPQEHKGFSPLQLEEYEKTLRLEFNRFTIEPVKSDPILNLASSLFKDREKYGLGRSDFVFSHQDEIDKYIKILDEKRRLDKRLSNSFFDRVLYSLLPSKRALYKTLDEEIQVFRKKTLAGRYRLIDVNYSSISLKFQNYLSSIDNKKVRINKVDKELITSSLSKFYSSTAFFKDKRFLKRSFGLEVDSNFLSSYYSVSHIDKVLANFLKDSLQVAEEFSSSTAPDYRDKTRLLDLFLRPEPSRKVKLQCDAYAYSAVPFPGSTNDKGYSVQFCASATLFTAVMVSVYNRTPFTLDQLNIIESLNCISMTGQDLYHRGYTSPLTTEYVKEKARINGIPYKNSRKVCDSCNKTLDNSKLEELSLKEDRDKISRDNYFRTKADFRVTR